jgi:hypothetical protein
MTDYVATAATVIELVVLWLVISAPTYLMARSRVGYTSGLLGQSIGATVSGGAAYEVVILVATITYGAIIGEGGPASLLALGCSAATWVILFRTSLRTTWVASGVMTLVATMMFVGINLILGNLFGVSLPTLFQFPI